MTTVGVKGLSANEDGLLTTYSREQWMSRSKQTYSCTVHTSVSPVNLLNTI